MKFSLLLLICCSFTSVYCSEAPSRNPSTHSLAGEDDWQEVTDKKTLKQTPTKKPAAPQDLLSTAAKRAPQFEIGDPTEGNKHTPHGNPLLAVSQKNQNCLSKLQNLLTFCCTRR